MKILLTHIFAAGLLLSSLLAFSAYAFDADDSSEDRLQQIQIEIENTETNSQKLKQHMATEKRELETVRASMVDITSAMQKLENNLNALENDIADKENQQDQIQSDLETDRRRIARLALALQRLRQVPPETIIVRPETPLNTVHANIILQSTLPLIYKESVLLKERLDTLQEISVTLSNKRHEMYSEKQKLEDKQNELEGLLAKRETIYKKHVSEYQKLVSLSKNLAKEATNIQDLMSKIENTNRLEAVKLSRQAVLSGVGRKMPMDSKVNMPVSGIVLTRYGEKDSIGALSRGIEFQSRAGAIVVAPMSGIVRYADTFGKFGNVVIIEHKDQYFSLVAGLGKIDTVVGRSVISGEPIGSLRKNTSASKTNLYYELRYKGKPINPSVKFVDLS